MPLFADVTAVPLSLFLVVLSSYTGGSLSLLCGAYSVVPEGSSPPYFIWLSLLPPGLCWDSSGD